MNRADHSTSLLDDAERVAAFYRENPAAPAFVARTVRFRGSNLTQAANRLRDAHAANAVYWGEVYTTLSEVSQWSWEVGPILVAEARAAFARGISERGTPIPPVGSSSSTKLAKPAHVIAAAQWSYAEGCLDSSTVSYFESLMDWSWKPEETNLTALIYAYCDLVDSGNPYEFERRGPVVKTLEVVIRNRGTVPLAHVLKLEALPCWSWDLAATEAKMLTVWVARHRAARAEHELANDGNADADGFDSDLLEMTEDRISDLGGQPALTNILANYAFNENSAPLDPPSAHDLDLLTRVIETMSRLGHSDFAGVDDDLSYDVDEWRRHPRSVHPFIYRALSEVDGWRWGEAEASLTRARPFMDAFVARTGHSVVPMGHIEDGFPLGDWVIEYVLRWRDSDPATTRYLQTLPGWVARRDQYVDRSAIAAWHAFFNEHGHAGILDSGTARDYTHLETRVYGWVKGGFARAERPVFPDETSALPDFPVGVRGPAAREAMRFSAIDRTLAIFRAREGAAAALPPNHVEATFPLGELAHELLEEMQEERRLGRYFTDEGIAMLAQLEEVCRP